MPPTFVAPLPHAENQKTPLRSFSAKQHHSRLWFHFLRLHRRAEVIGTISLAFSSMTIVEVDAAVGSVVVGWGRRRESTLVWLQSLQAEEDNPVRVDPTIADLMTIHQVSSTYAVFLGRWCGRLDGWRYHYSLTFGTEQPRTELPTLGEVDSTSLFRACAFVIECAGMNQKW